MIVELLQNVALLVALAVGLQMLSRKFAKHSFLYRVAQGLLFGLVGIAGMMTPLRFAEGVIYDGRSIVLTLAGLFGGPLTAGIAACICAAYRAWLGGPGAIAGVSVVVEAALIGTLLYYLRQQNEKWVRPLSLVGFGLMVHALMLALQLLIPGKVGVEVFRQIGLVVLVLYPLGFLLAAQVFLEIERTLQSDRALRESEERFRQLAELAPVGIAIHDCAGKTIYVSPKFVELFGYDKTDIPSVAEWWSLAYPDPVFREQVRHEWTSAIETARARGEEAPPVEHPVTCKDGTVRHIEFRAAASGDFNIIVFSDISERKRAEESLLERERYLRAILQTTADGFWVLDTEGRVVEANGSYCAMSGYSREELIGMSINAIDTIESPEDTRNKMERVVKNGWELFETSHRRKDGSVFPVEISTTYLASEGGRFVCFCRDLTERKRAEEGLVHSRDLLRYIIDHMQGGIAVHDRNLRYVYVSQSYLDQYGITGLDIIGKHHYEVFPDLPQKWRDVHQRVLAGDVCSADRDPYHRDDGRTDWTRWECRPWYEADGSIGGIVVYTEIISDRVEAEEKLRRSESRYRTLAENFPNGALFLIDRDRRYLAADGKALAEAGLEPGQIVGKTVREVFPELWDTLKPYADRAFACESVYYEIEYRKRLYSNHAVPIDIRKDAAEHVIIITQDITDRRRAEEEREKLRYQLAQSQKMESVGRLAGGVAHDFNNMLNVILGHCDLALEDLAQDAPLRADLEEIRAAAVRSTDLTRQLLAFARRQTVAPKVLDLNVTIGRMLKMLGRLIGEDIDLLWKPAPKLKPVRIDPAQIDQLLANLIVNARDAIRHDTGKVTIETGQAEFDEDYCDSHPGYTPGRYAMLAVSDNGAGMDETTRTHIFEPFFTTKKVGEGTGLGLATVYGIVRQNKGFINVYSEPERGSTFRIYLPVHEAADTARAAERAESPAAIPGSETILLVEDEAVILQLGRRMLERLGYTVLAANSPAEALDLVIQHDEPIHLLITDVVMPGMNGRELAERVKTVRPHIKVLFTSGYTGNVIAHHGVLDAGLQFIQKPYGVNELSAKIRETLGENGSQERPVPETATGQA